MIDRRARRQVYIVSFITHVILIFITSFELQILSWAGLEKVHRQRRQVRGVVGW